MTRLWKREIGIFDKNCGRISQNWDGKSKLSLVRPIQVLGVFSHGRGGSQLETGSGERHWLWHRNPGNLKLHHPGPHNFYCTGLCLRVLTIIQESDEDCFYSCNTVHQVNFTATWIWPVTFVISRWSMRVDRFHLIIKQVVQTLNISLYDFTHWTQHYRIANPLIVFHHDHVAWTKDEKCVKWVE